MSSLELRDVQVRYGRRAVVAGFSDLVRSGEWLGLIGPNGAGKSSLLRAVVGIAPWTGEILAAGSEPQPKEPPFRNQAITDQFEPGSTFKMVVASAALEEKVAEPSTMFNAENGAYDFGKFVIHDSHPHGMLTFADAVRFSSNIVAGKLGVAHLLEGTVRRSGSTVRVTADLVDGATGFSDWSRMFERELKDIFSVQSEIASTVADAIVPRVSASGSGAVWSAAP